MKRICETCRWYEPFNGVCCNGSSEYCTEFMWQDGDGCEKWEAVQK